MSESIAKPRRHLASDTYAGICPEALEAMLAANAEGHAAGYGDDAWTAKACDGLREIFETDCEVFFVFNGTAANVLGLRAVVESHQAVLCSEESHLNRHECGAPARLIGCKLITLPHEGGKIRPAAVERIRNAVRREVDIKIDVLNYRKDGSTFHNALYVGPVRDEEGKVVYFFASQLDVSEHHRMQAEIDDLKARLADAEGRPDRR